MYFVGMILIFMLVSFVAFMVTGNIHIALAMCLVGFFCGNDSKEGVKK